MLTDKYSVNQMVEIMAQLGLRHVIVSPGSRNAPITLAFSAHKEIECLSIVDERSASFFALGMAQQLRKPVAVVCTSGTAALNYAPALAEAFYQGIPIIAITADRPVEWIDQMEGQSIRQRDIFRNYVKASYEFIQEASDSDSLRYNARIASEAYNRSCSGSFGPVHLNIPLREPLYDMSSEGFPEQVAILNTDFERKLTEEAVKSLAAELYRSKRTLILTGMIPFDKELNQLLECLADQNSVVVLTERTSNLHGERFMDCTDRIISSLNENEIGDFKPDLLISIGRDVVSKKIKAFLRKNKPVQHWHIDEERTHLDTYQSLTKNIQVCPKSFIRDLLPFIRDNGSDYYSVWKQKDEQTENYHQQFLETCEYSDLKVFQRILNRIPENSQLQLASSTPVRYAQLFKPMRCLKYYSNRGTSGIDGAVSTAAGAAYMSDDFVTLITGDISFLYDSNALWNKHLNKNFRIIVINNGGGGIFRFIDGPEQASELDTYFVTPHLVDISKLVEAFGVKHYLCDHIEKLEQTLNLVYLDQDAPVVLEVKTPDRLNAKVLKDYFKNLKIRNKK